jgi:hypothetical protein
MKRTFLFLILIGFFNLSFSQSDPFMAMYLNFGQAIPLGRFKADNKSNKPSEIAKSKQLFMSFNLGMDVFLSNKIGLTGGFSYYKFLPDKRIFESMHANSTGFTDSYLIDELGIFKLYGGIIYRLKYKKLNIEPRLILGYSAYKDGLQDFYEKDQNGSVVRTINYDLYNDGFFSYSCVINFNYDLINYDPFILGIQFFTEYTFQRIRLEGRAIESDKFAKTIVNTNLDYNQNIATFYYGAGLILKISN